MRFLEWVREHPQWVGRIGTVVGLVVLGLIVAGMLWLDDLLPQRLIPWIDVERM